MKVVINGNTYDVMFKHNKTSIAVNNNYLIDTVCRISKEDVSKRGDERFIFIMRGDAYQSKKDKFNRWKGKKIAFAKALRLSYFSYDERAIFWNVFFKNFPKAKDKKYCNN